MPSKPRAAVILAAGHGTRMKSALAKPLHPVAGRSMLDWSLELADKAGADRKVVVWGEHSPAIKDAAEAAGAPVKFDISKLEPGEMKTVDSVSP